MSGDDYEALLIWAKAGAEGDAASFLALRRRVDAANGLTRHVLVIRYDTLPWMPGREHPYGPRGLTTTLEGVQPFTREDVLRAVDGAATAPALIFVTRDVRGEVGWYSLDDFPWS